MMAGNSACKLVFGGLSNPCFKDESICLVTATNAVTCQNFGLLKDIVNIYPYADVAGERYTKPGVSYACERDRGIEGSAILSVPMRDTHPGYPSVATLITQYGIGNPIESNQYARNSVRYSVDSHHVKNLLRDTEDRRMENFLSALKDLKERLYSREFDRVQYVLIPAGVGRRGQVDEVWLTYYLPTIFTVSESLCARGKTVCIVMSENAFKCLDGKFAGNPRGANLLRPLKELELSHDIVGGRVGEDTCGGDRGPSNFVNTA